MPWRGILAFEQSDYSRAAALVEQSLALRREIRDKLGSAESLMGLGLIARDQGNHRRAIMLFGEGLALARQMRDKYLIAGVARLACTRSRRPGRLQQCDHAIG